MNKAKNLSLLIAALAFASCGSDGLQESALSPPPSQPVFLESGTSRAELYD